LLTDLVEFERRPNAAWGGLLRVDLSNLTEDAGAALLHHAGAKRAGAADINTDDAELLAATREVNGHALTLNLLGRFLARAHEGDIRRRHLVNFEDADRKDQGGTTFKMLAAFERWFSRSGNFAARELAVLRMLGLFDRPADAACINSLRNPPLIAGITEPLFISKGHGPGHNSYDRLIDEDWNTLISYLSDFGLLVIQSTPDNRERLLDCHPLIREYFATRLQLQSPSAWQQAQYRLFAHLSATAMEYPETLNEMEPLYHAVPSAPSKQILPC
jgi:hypothetical protein